MADYPISNVARRVVYTGSAGVGPYAFSFEVLQNTDIVVYKNDVLLTLTTDYTVTISPTLGTGSVTLVSAATGSDRITIVGARAVQRTTDFTTGGDFFANTLNDELDSQTILIQQVAETAERAIKAPVTDPTNINMTLPNNTTRANKLLGFDANGNPTVLPQIYSIIDLTTQVTGTLPVDNGGTGTTTSTGTGSAVLSDAPTLSGAVTIGSTSGTNVLTLGRSVDSQAVNIATGATTNVSTKTVNIATAGTSGSTTAVNIGSAVSGATNNIAIGDAASTSATTIAGTVTIGNTSGTDTLTLGRSTGAQTVNVASGATNLGTKTLNLATGATNGTTSINIGPTATVNGPTTVNIGAQSRSSNNTTVNIATGSTGGGALVNIGSSANSGSLTTINGGLDVAPLAGNSIQLRAPTNVTVTVGNTNTTGTMTLGQSTVTNTTNIQSGATSSGNTKTVNIGTGGVSGSTTNITIGTNSGGTSTTTINGNVSATGAVSGGYIAHTAGTTAMGFGTDNVVRVTPNATATYTTTVPPAGAICVLSILTSGTTSYTITFGTGFKTTGTLATGTVSARYFNITFVSDGTDLIETARTVAIA